MLKPMKIHEAILLLGSNIEPENNIFSALNIIHGITPVVAQSQIWKTRAIGSDGPDFLNSALKIQTVLDKEGIKYSIIQPVEHQLGRVRSADKYAPRTIDVDIIVFDHQVLDPRLWELGFIAVPVSEIATNLIHPQTGKHLRKIAEEFKSSTEVELFITGSNSPLKFEGFGTP